ncbi:MAG: 2-C-methyl-D-erythritol 4-phosphate cytidylyltransferase [Actinomycetota bacterium]
MTAAAVAIVLAAGRGARLGLSEPKGFVGVAGRPLVARAVEAAAGCPAVASVVVTVPAGSEERARAVTVSAKPVVVVAGGASRHASVGAALAAIPKDVPIVVCHDAARPFASSQLFLAVVEALNAGDADGAIPVVLVPDTVKRVRDGFVVGTEATRAELALAQTPQAFRADALRDAHEKAAREGLEFTDDAAALEWAGYRVKAVAGEPGNFKVTTVEDLARAAELAEEPARG